MRMTSKRQFNKAQPLHNFSLFTCESSGKTSFKWSRLYLIKINSERKEANAVVVGKDLKEAIQ